MSAAAPPTSPIETALGDVIRARGDMAAHVHTLVRETMGVAERTGRGPTVVELGVRTGQSTVAFLHAIERIGDGRLWSVDHDTPRVAAIVTVHPAWTFVRSDDLRAARRAPTPIDVLFVDTSHTRPHTHAELAAYAPKVRPGGRIILHDTTPTCGVWGALGDWLHGRTGWWTIEVYPESYGLAVVRV